MRIWPFPDQRQYLFLIHHLLFAASLQGNCNTIKVLWSTSEKCNRQDKVSQNFHSEFLPTASDTVINNVIANRRIQTSISCHWSITLLTHTKILSLLKNYMWLDEVKLYSVDNQIHIPILRQENRTTYGKISHVRHYTFFSDIMLESLFEIVHRNLISKIAHGLFYTATCTPVLCNFLPCGQWFNHSRLVAELLSRAVRNLSCIKNPWHFPLIKKKKFSVQKN